MRLKVFDRILLAILLIAAILTSFVFFAMAANLIQLSTVQSFAALLYASRQNALILAGSGLVLLLICLKLLFAGRGEKKEEVAPASTRMAQNEIGGTFISLAAIGTMVQKYCEAQPRISDCHSTLRSEEDGVTIGIRLSTLADTDIAALTRELQTGLKEHVETLTGITVKEIGILVENANAQPTARVE